MLGKLNLSLPANLNYREIRGKITFCQILRPRHVLVRNVYRFIVTILLLGWPLIPPGFNLFILFADYLLNSNGISPNCTIVN